MCHCQIFMQEYFPTFVGIFILEYFPRFVGIFMQEYFPRCVGIFIKEYFPKFLGIYILNCFPRSSGKIFRRDLHKIYHAGSFLMNDMDILFFRSQKMHNVLERMQKQFFDVFEYIR